MKWRLPGPQEPAQAWLVRCPTNPNRLGQGLPRKQGMLEMALDDQEIINRFPVGYYPLHPNVSLNFQMNRFWNWVGDKQMLDELRAAGTRIKSYDDWAREMFDLSDKALAAGRRLPAAYYAKMAIFFLDPSDARVKPAFKRFLDNVLAESGVTPENHHLFPYQQAELTAYRFTPEKPRGTIVVFGGYDSYILEWLPMALAMRDAGLDTIIFDGPGQGTALDAGIPMTPDWHLPVAAILAWKRTLCRGLETATSRRCFR
jgi:hypothetical protein